MGKFRLLDTNGITKINEENEAAFLTDYNLNKSEWNSEVEAQNLDNIRDLETKARNISTGGVPSPVPTEWILKAPYRFICKLIIHYPGYSSGGSGVLISPQHILTAGHCILPQYESGYPISVDVYPALSGTTAHVGWQSSNRFFVPNKWEERRGTLLSRNYDFGLVELPDTLLYDRLHGHFQLSELDENTNPNQIPVFSGGYRDLPPDDSEAPIGNQFGSQGKILKIHKKSISFTNQLVFGFSGSPLFFISDYEYHTIAVCAYGYSGNYGPKMRADIYQEMREWIENG